MQLWQFRLELSEIQLPVLVPTHSGSGTVCSVDGSCCSLTSLLNPRARAPSHAVTFSFHDSIFNTQAAWLEGLLCLLVWWSGVHPALWSGAKSFHFLTTDRFTVKFASNIHGPQRLNLNNFLNSLTFHLSFPRINFFSSFEEIQHSTAVLVPFPLNVPVVVSEWWGSTCSKSTLTRDQCSFTLAKLNTGPTQCCNVNRK